MAASTPVWASLIVVATVSLLLAALVLNRYRRERQACHLYWGAGLLLFFVTVVEESVLFGGVWSQPLIRSYLILVAVLVGLLSIGSAEIALPRLGRRLWAGFVGVASAVLAVVGALTPVPSSILSGGVVSGLPPTTVDVLSSVITFPAATLLIVASLYGAIRLHRTHLVFIAAGTLIVAAAGTLYIASLPTSLYYAEFAGVVLLFLGFVRIPHAPAPEPGAHAAT